MVVVDPGDNRLVMVLAEPYLDQTEPQVVNLQTEPPVVEFEPPATAENLQQTKPPVETNLPPQIEPPVVDREPLERHYDLPPVVNLEPPVETLGPNREVEIGIVVEPVHKDGYS